MARGRKPIPTQLKVLKGTHRKGRENKDEPKPQIIALAPPDWLTGRDALMAWGYYSERLYRLGLLTEIDRDKFGQFCAALGRLAYAERKVAEMMNNGEELFTITGKGGVIQNAYVGMANKASSLVDSLGANFGLDASSRSRIKVEAPKEDTVSPFVGLGG